MNPVTEVHHKCLFCHMNTTLRFLRLNVCEICRDQVYVNDRPYGAIRGSAYWRHPMIGLIEPPDDRPNGATSGSA
jgi:hypothetical protein